MNNSNLYISGLFEIHITVDEHNMHPFRLYCLDNKLKPIYAISDKCQPQLMLSKYKNSILKFNPRSYLDLKSGNVNFEIAKSIKKICGSASIPIPGFLFSFKSSLLLFIEINGR